MNNFFVSNIWRAEKPMEGLWAIIISGGAAHRLLSPA